MTMYGVALGLTDIQAHTQWPAHVYSKELQHTGNTFVVSFYFRKMYGSYTFREDNEYTRTERA